MRTRASSLQSPREDLCRRVGAPHAPAAGRGGRSAPRLDSSVPAVRPRRRVLRALAWTRLPLLVGRRHWRSCH